MGRKSKYTEEFKNTIIELYKSGKSVAESSNGARVPGLSVIPVKDLANSNSDCRVLRTTEG